jgi:hypothetical protein
LMNSTLDLSSGNIERPARFPASLEKMYIWGYCFRNPTERMWLGDQDLVILNLRCISVPCVSAQHCTIPSNSYLNFILLIRNSTSFFKSWANLSRFWTINLSSALRYITTHPSTYGCPGQKMCALHIMEYRPVPFQRRGRL